MFVTVAGGAAAVLVVVTVVLRAGAVVVRCSVVVRVTTVPVCVPMVSAALDTVCPATEPQAAVVPPRTVATIRANTR